MGNVLYVCQLRKTPTRRLKCFIRKTCASILFSELSFVAVPVVCWRSVKDVCCWTSTWSSHLLRRPELSGGSIDVFLRLAIVLWIVKTIHCYIVVDSEDNSGLLLVAVLWWFIVEKHPPDVFIDVPFLTASQSSSFLSFVRVCTEYGNFVFFCFFFSF